MSPELVRVELEKLLASATFSHAPRLSRFLRLVVERTLAGGAADIKEYPIGVEVFDRGDDFDPRVDPVVRVEARRLRAKLAEYYEGNGCRDTLKIRLPKGSYVPVFEEATPAPVKPKADLRLKWAVPGLMVAIGAAIYLTAGQRREPVVAVLPTTSMDESDEAIRFGRQVSEDLCANFARSGKVRVIAWPAVVAYQAQYGNDSYSQFSAKMHSEYVVAVSVHVHGDRARILVHLIVPSKNLKVWAADYDRRLTPDALSTEGELARQMSDEILGWLGRGR